MNIVEAVKTEPLSKIQELVKNKSITADSNWLDYEALNTALKYGRKDIAKYLLTCNCRVIKMTNPFTPSDTPLHNATRLGDLSLISLIFKKKTVLWTTNLEGNTALHLAFLYKHESIIDVMLQLIVQTSSYSNFKNNEGLSHLHIACTRKRKDVIEGILKDGAAIDQAVNINSISWAGYNALHFAAEFKSIPAIQVLTSKPDWQIYDKPNVAGKTPSQIIHGQLEEMTIMSSLMSRNKFSYFHLACTQRSPNNLQKFFENGANVNDTVSFYSGFCPKDTPLHCAVKSRWMENVELVLKQNPDTSLKNIDDMTPLHLAMYGNDKDIVNLLYKTSEMKDQDATDKNGLNFFHIACSQNDLVKAQEFLLNKGRNVNSQVLYDQRIFFRYTALHFAVRNKHSEMVEWLIRNGANVNLGEDSVDGTPLHLAFALGHVDIIEILLKNGADPLIVRSDDRTMIHSLVQYCIGQFENDNTKLLLPYIDKLVELNVDINAQDTKGNSALHMASESVFGGVSCLKVLLEFGADVNLKNDKGETPFDLHVNADFNRELVQPGDYTIMYHHVQKLKALGIKIDPKNEECCNVLRSKNMFVGIADFKDRQMKMMQQKRLDEIDKLKKFKIIDSESIYDFLHHRVKRAADFTKCKTLVDLLEAKNFEKRFPIYGFLIKLQYRKALKCLTPKNVFKKDISFENDDDEMSFKRRRCYLTY